MKFSEIPALFNGSDYYNSLKNDLLLEENDNVYIDEKFIVKNFNYQTVKNISQALSICSFWGMNIPDELLFSIYSLDNCDFLIDENNREFISRIKQIKKLIEYILYENFMHFESIIEISKLLTNDLMCIITKFVPEIIHIIYVLQSKISEFQNIINTPYIESLIISAAIVSNSIECLKILNITEITETEILGKYGKSNFITLLQENNITFEDLMAFSILNNNYNLIDYYNDEKQDIIQYCIYYHNLTSLKYLIEKYNIDLNDYDIDYSQLDEVYDSQFGTLDIVKYLVNIIEYDWGIFCRRSIINNDREFFEFCLKFTDEIDTLWIEQSMIHCSIDFVEYILSLFEEVDPFLILQYSIESNDINKLSYFTKKYFSEKNFSGRYLYSFILILKDKNKEICEYFISLVNKDEYKIFKESAALFGVYHLLLYFEKLGMKIETNIISKSDNYQILKHFNLPIHVSIRNAQREKEMLQELKTTKRIENIDIEVEDITNLILLRYALAEKNILCDRNILLKLFLEDGAVKNILTILTFSENIDKSLNLIEKYKKSTLFPNKDILKMLKNFGFNE